MKAIHEKTTAIIMLLTAILLLSACSFRDDPPSADEARRFLNENREDIDRLVEYMMSMEYDDIFISKPLNRNPGKVFYEFEWHDISSKEVIASVRGLWRAGCTIIQKDDQNENNTIFFMIWQPMWGERDCGIAITINGHGTPKTQFQTRHAEIGDGWFYYFNDYEEYRIHPSQYAEYQPKYGT